MRSLYFLIASFIFNSTTIQAKDISLEEVEQVVTDIYNAFQLKDIQCPAVLLLDSESKVASYNPNLHLIKIERNVLALCASYEADRLNALAFIIGHEMTHAYQDHLDEKGHEFNFLDYSNNIKSSYKIEKTADIQGAFAAYIAGYKTHHIIPKLLSDIYSKYGLHSKTLSQYPSYEERLATGLEVQETVKALTTAHRLANMMTLFECYDVANAIYTDVLSYYEGPELYYNIGLNYLLEALNFSRQRIDKYAYPFEIEAETRMSKPYQPGGSKDLSMEDMRRRQMLLNSAELLIKKGLTKNPSKQSWAVTLAAINVLNEKPGETIAYLQQLKEETESSKMILGIAYATQNSFYSIQKANDLFTHLKASSNEITQKRAVYNSEVLYGSDYECHDLVIPSPELGNVALTLSDLKAVKFKRLPMEASVTIKQGGKGPDRYYLIKHDGSAYYIKDHMLKNGILSDLGIKDYHQLIKLGPEYALKTKNENVMVHFISQEGVITRTASILY